jgi:hypothetical protein
MTNAGLAVGDEVNIYFDPANNQLILEKARPHKAEATPAAARRRSRS